MANNSNNQKEQTNFKPIYLLSGTNEHAKNKEISRLKEIALEGDANEFNFDTLYSDIYDAQKVIGLANTLPFYGNTRLIILKRFDEYSAKEKKILAEYAINPNTQTCLILVDDAKPDKRESWYKIFDENKTTVDIKAFWPYSYKELTQLIISSFKTKDKTIEYNAAMVLAELIENNPAGLDEEIKKIIDYNPTKTNILLDDIQENVKKSPNHDIYEWAMKVTKGEYSDSILFLNNFSPKEMQAPQLLLYVLTDRFIKIFRYLTLLGEGMQQKTAQQSLGIITFLDPDFHRQAVKFDIKKLTKIFSLLINVDFNIKLSKGNPKFLLEDFILNLKIIND